MKKSIRRADGGPADAPGGKGRPDVPRGPGPDSRQAIAAYLATPAGQKLQQTFQSAVGDGPMPLSGAGQLRGQVLQDMFGVAPRPWSNIPDPSKPNVPGAVLPNPAYSAYMQNVTQAGPALGQLMQQYREQNPMTPHVPQPPDRQVSQGNWQGGQGNWQGGNPPNSLPPQGFKKGGVVKSKSSASRGDGIAQRGKTKGRMV